MKKDVKSFVHIADIRSIQCLSLCKHVLTNALLFICYDGHRKGLKRK